MHFNTAVITLSLLGSALATPFFNTPKDRDNKGRDPVDMCVMNFEDCMMETVRSYGYICDAKLVACLHGHDASQELDGEDMDVEDVDAEDRRGRRGRGGRGGRGRRGRNGRGRLGMNDEIDGDYIPGDDKRMPEDMCKEKHHDGDMIPDQNDCGRFYSCSNGKAYHMTCPGNLHFNRMSRICDYPERAMCHRRRDL